MAWLMRQKDLPLPNRTGLDVPKSLPVVGDCVICDAAPSKTGYDNIVLVQSTFPEEDFETLMKQFKAEWSTARSEAQGLKGIKSAPLRITCPVTDDPTLYLEHAPVEYGLIHAFHHLVERNSAVYDHFLREALQYRTVSGRRMPGAVAVDATVILSGNELLLSHRIARKGGYNPELWSATLEEHFSVAKSTWGNREHPADMDIEDTIVRGLREEFVSQDSAKEILVSVHAVTLDLVNLNLQFQSVVHLPDTSFEELAEAWRSPETPDRGEHDTLATLEFKASTIRRALLANSPGQLTKSSAGENYSERSEHPWHPRSRARLACCLWLLEEASD